MKSIQAVQSPDIVWLQIMYFCCLKAKNDNVYHGPTKYLINLNIIMFEGQHNLYCNETKQFTTITTLLINCQLVNFN